MYTYRPDRPLREQTLTTARQRLTEPGFEEAWARGQTMDLEQAVEYALQEDGTSTA